MIYSHKTTKKRWVTGWPKSH